MKGRWKERLRKERGEEERRKKSEREKRYRTDRGPWLTGEHAREWMLFDVNGYLAGMNLIYSIWTTVWIIRSNTGDERNDRIERAYHLPYQSSNSRFVRLEIEEFFFFFFFYIHQISYIRRSMNRYVVNYVHTTRYLTFVILRKFPDWYIVYTRASKVPDETQCVCDVQ